MSSPNTLEVKSHYNFKQRLIHLVNAKLTTFSGGRGVGKTTGVVAPRIIHCCKVMPRSAGTFVSTSFRKFTDHQLPSLRKGWEKIKLIEDRDYVIMKKPPEHWDKPHMAPGSYGRFVTFRNGSGFHIISFDPNQTANGLDTDWNITDEAKLLDGNRVQEEVFNTMRGNRDVFGHRPEHYSKWILSDKYTRTNSKQSRWFEDYKSKASSDSEIQEIIELALLLQECNNEKLKAAVAERLYPLQQEASFYLEAETLDNIHAVGEEYIMDMIKSNSPIGALISIFNMDIKREEGSLFYPLFSEISNTYEASDNSKVQEHIWSYGLDDYLNNRSCKLDTDLQKGLRLKIFIDFGGTYNWAVVAQLQHNVFRCLKNFVVEKPKKLRDLVFEICQYYRHHDNRNIELYYGIDGKKENYSDYKTDATKLKEKFNDEGWSVIDKMEDITAWVSHKNKYDFGLLLMDSRSDRDDRVPKFMANNSNCQELIWSVSRARLKPGEKNYEKDKSDEKNINIPQWQATHLSDCIDWLAIDYLDVIGDSSNYTVSLHPQ